ncbi:MAG: cobyrinate a,c-diamide synthase [Synergistaceae bacterium]|jgi:cobyrinic acid a,c-diamide synthase|nr:cobyrinate a,c-diamide synthase [Synergistaceae bacterium]
MARNFSNTRGFVVAAASSGVGKTTVASAICRILRDRGYVIQPFKTGPDFIDPTYLTLAAGRECGNLDGHPCPDLMPYLYAEGCGSHRIGSEADIAVVEGVMGLYDGLGAEGLYSTAWLARTLDLPVVLLVSARAVAASVAAVVKGFASLEPLAPQITGVIANQASGPEHAELIGEAVSKFAGIPLIGWLPAIPGDGFSSRHLGLVPALERVGTEETIERCARELASRLDVGALLEMARLPSGRYEAPEIETAPAKPDGSPVRVSVASDDAFGFHYRENWSLLERQGAEVSMTSPLRDDAPPEDTDLLILPGGYPEVFSGQLSGNAKYMEWIRDFSRRGFIYAECGGMLYLARGMEYEGVTRGMVGLIDADVKMTKELRHFGYVEAAAVRDNLLFKSGDSLRAHEFHYSKLVGEAPAAFSVRKSSGKGEAWTDGFVMMEGRGLATYLHINFYSCPGNSARMLSLAAGGRG